MKPRKSRIEGKAKGIVVLEPTEGPPKRTRLTIVNGKGRDFCTMWLATEGTAFEPE